MSKQDMPIKEPAAYDRISKRRLGMLYVRSLLPSRCATHGLRIDCADYSGSSDDGDRIAYVLRVTSEGSDRLIWTIVDLAIPV
jgi:hypothetical protein